MVSKIYPGITRVFSSFILLFTFQVSFACGWYESAETSRLALFKSERKGFLKLHYFCYSANSFHEVNEVSNKDQELNCLEWQKKIGANVSTADIYTILYETDSDVFQAAYQSNSLKQVFKNNTFIATLLRLKNKPFLDYLILAKKLEYNNVPSSKWESWSGISSYPENVNTVAIGDYNQKILSAKDAFLKQRYAFLILRDRFYSSDKTEVIRLYDTYFANNKGTILEPWALYYKALCIDSLPLRNYLLSQVFASCDDKSLAVMQHYNFKHTAATLSLAKNNEERNMILVIESMRNPAPDLSTIKQVYKFDPNSIYFSFLVQREVNKLEDWIFTPKYSNNKVPAVSFDKMSWYDNYEKAKTDNFNKDILYLRELKQFLIDAYSEVSGEQKDFIASAIAQLCFIDDEIDLGKKYVNMISVNANISIQLQKNIQLALITLKQDNLQDKNTQNNLFSYFNVIEDLVQEDISLLKNLYSLYRIASDEFSKQGDKAIAGLLFLKSMLKKGAIDNSWYYYVPSFYEYTGYFERYATLEDMDKLIALYQKEDKTPFEKYICAGTLAPDINFYRDVKGTIAFRKNNLAVAYQVFASMPANFWDKNYEFKNNLNEDPFVPKVLQKAKERKFNYRFNKAEFVARLIELKKENTATSNLLLAHAYFNISYWGNSWMMLAYDWASGTGVTNSDYMYGGDNYDSEMMYQNSNYYRCTLAKMYYEKALKLSKDKEEKALASLMIFECNYYDYYRNSDVSPDKVAAFKSGKEIADFYSVYNTTKTFKQYNCPLLEMFIK
ncbi:hypothetical protein [Flavobacterium hydatis]|uniref:Lipoprotein n=1 Tax=Flavobacterium hydatis TaxID=991 RepID=A0A086A4V1_FLAHY|nr:hypothetical protein [Flavobacterium hydatis]KFF11715.1 hypothetical protein IW20_19090 [Flavobacterium hydatis]OXA88425.1 hypothetical protein B0A62_22095 [Flavobacterium hydatis]